MATSISPTPSANLLQHLPALVARTTRLLVFVSAVAALLLEIALARNGWTALPAICGLAALLGVVAGRFTNPLGVGMIAAAGAILPVAITLILGRFYYQYMTVWFSALLGAFVVARRRLGWSFPQSWQPPLAFWALVVSISWPIVVLREADFRPALLISQGTLTTMWAAHVALVHLVGILWLNWLFEQFARTGSTGFRRSVLIPFIVAATLGSGLAAYQGLLRVDFASAGGWSILHRAAGSLLDANSSGVLAAVWGPAACALALSRLSAGRFAAGVGALALGWMGLWATGSRTALLAGVIGTGYVVVYATKLASSRILRIAAFCGAITVICALAVFLRAGDWITESAVQRILWFIPEFSGRGFTIVGHELWERNGYGTAALQMIHDSPLFGTGAGSFHILAGDYGSLAGVGRLPADNAQNWYRHQLAEFGLIGGLGWMVWIGMFALLLVRGRAQRDELFACGVVKGLLIALGIISLVGMPAQNPVITVTFWTLVFWCVLLTNQGQGKLAPSWSFRRVTSLWVAVCLLAGIYGVGATHVSRTKLRVPYRALRTNSDYMYGFYQPEPTDDGGNYRWAAKHAVAVIPADTRWFELSVSVNHFDVERNPVHAKIWWERRLVIDTILRNIEPVRMYVRIPDDRQRALIETWVDRTLRPAEYGIRDDRELGLAVEWRFVSRPPVGAPTIDARRTKPPWT